MKPSISYAPAIAGIFAAAVCFADPVAAQSIPLEIPFVAEWAASPHARAGDEPFTHWDE